MEKEAEMILDDEAIMNESPAQELITVPEKSQKKKTN